MNNAIDQSKLLDGRNQDLFELVCSKFEVTFELSPGGHHSIYTIGNQITFYIPEGDYCVDTFSHELLHGYMDYCGVNITGNLKNTISASNLLSKIFDTDLIEHVTNSVAHTLMLPIFLERGFERDKFLSDYEDFKAEHGLVNQISKLYKRGNQYQVQTINAFIGKYFAFRCDPNPAFNYQNELGQLKKIDPQLYEILDKYLRLWEDYDFTDDEFSVYREINMGLYNNLKPWMSGKKFA
jgi:hypothetical protein